MLGQAEVSFGHGLVTEVLHSEAVGGGGGARLSLCVMIGGAGLRFRHPVCVSEVGR